ncbi:hypothetical protein T439DRAFT_380769 [Meredithblackwellia eburnea MCA 4105]
MSSHREFSVFEAAKGLPPLFCTSGSYHTTAWQGRGPAIITFTTLNPHDESTTFVIALSSWAAICRSQYTFSRFSPIFSTPPGKKGTGTIGRKPQVWGEQESIWILEVGPTAWATRHFFVVKNPKQHQNHAGSSSPGSGGSFSHFHSVAFDTGRRPAPTTALIQNQPPSPLLPVPLLTPPPRSDSVQSIFDCYISDDSDITTPSVGAALPAEPVAFTFARGAQLYRQQRTKTRRRLATSLSVLPDELLDQIFEYLSPSQRTLVGQTCTRFRRIIVPSFDIRSSNGTNDFRQTLQHAPRPVHIHQLRIHDNTRELEYCPEPPRLNFYSAAIRRPLQFVTRASTWRHTITPSTFANSLKEWCKVNSLEFICLNSNVVDFTHLGLGEKLYSIKLSFKTIFDLNQPLAGFSQVAHLHIAHLQTTPANWHLILSIESFPRVVTLILYNTYYLDDEEIIRGGPQSRPTNELKFWPAFGSFASRISTLGISSPAIDFAHFTNVKVLSIPATYLLDILETNGWEKLFQTFPEHIRLCRADKENPRWAVWGGCEVVWKMLYYLKNSQLVGNLKSITVPPAEWSDDRLYTDFVEIVLHHDALNPHWNLRIGRRIGSCPHWVTETDAHTESFIDEY